MIQSNRDIHLENIQVVLQILQAGQATHQNAKTECRLCEHGTVPVYDLTKLSFTYDFKIGPVTIF